VRQHFTRIIGALLVAGALSGGVYQHAQSGGGGGGGSTCATTCFYVRDGASGDGSSWSSACDDFAASCAVSGLTRGATYYVAAGTYASRRFDTPTSGTSRITIKGATVADHGDDAGWSDAYAVGTGGNQAHWTTADVAGQYVQAWDVGGASYFTFDGAVACGTTGGPPCDDPTTYGFTMDQPSPCTSNQFYVEYGYNGGDTAGTMTSDTFAHIATVGCGGDVGRVGFGQFQGNPTVSSLTFSHIYCEEMEACVDYRASLHQYSDLVVEYLYDLNSFSSSSHHGEQINLLDNVDTATVRWSIFTGLSSGALDGGTGTIMANDSSPTTPCANHVYVYGNVFNDQHGGNGVIGSTDACALQDAQVFNNTFANLDAATQWFHTSNGSSTGNVAKDNIVYSSDAGVTGLGTHDFNTYCSDTNVPSETNGSTAACSFVDAAGLDFDLTADTAAWTATGIPAGDGVDMDGVTRTSSRGAFQH
jgi:hypothetical protein